MAEEEKKWVPWHEIAEMFLKSDPEMHFVTVVESYALGAKIPAKNAQFMIDAIWGAEEELSEQMWEDTAQKRGKAIRNLYQQQWEGTTAKIGQYVTAKLVNGESGEPRQGIFVKDNGDGTIIVKGQLEIYVCLGPTGIAIVDEKSIADPGVLEFIKNVRQQIGIANAVSLGEISS